MKRRTFFQSILAALSFVPLLRTLDLPKKSKTPSFADAQWRHFALIRVDGTVETTGPLTFEKEPDQSGAWVSSWFHASNT